MAAEEQNMTQDRHLGIEHGEGRVVKRTYRDEEGIHVVYQDGSTLLAEKGKAPKLTKAS